MTDPTAWKQPRRRSDDIRDDYRRLLAEELRAMRDPLLTDHGRGYVSGCYDGIYAAMRLTLSDEDAATIVDQARRDAS